MRRSLDFPSSYRSLSASHGIVIFIIITALLSPGLLQAQALKKVPFPFSPIGLNCLPWFVAKDARIFEKHGIDFDPVFIGASWRCSTPCYQARRIWPDRVAPR